AGYPGRRPSSGLPSDDAYAPRVGTARAPVDDAYRPPRTHDAYTPPPRNDAYAPPPGPGYAQAPGSDGRPAGYPVQPNAAPRPAYGEPYTPPPGQPYGPPPTDPAYAPPPGPRSEDEAPDGSYSSREILEAGRTFFGSVSKGLASVVEYAFKQQG